MELSPPPWRALAALLAVTGVTHLLRPRLYAGIVPPALGDPYPWVYGSGVAELGCAAGLLAPRSRSRAALATAALFVAVFPANVQMAADALRSPRTRAGYRVASVLRLPVQVPLVLWALGVARSSRRDGAGAA